LCLAFANHVAHDVEIDPLHLLELAALRRREEAHLPQTRQHGRVFAVKAGVTADDVGEPLDGAGVGGERLPRPTEQVCHREMANLVEELLLSLDVMIEARLREPDFARQLADAGGGVALAAEHFGGGVEQRTLALYVDDHHEASLFLAWPVASIG
jgi:hypothetical protein